MSDWQWNLRHPQSPPPAGGGEPGPSVPSSLPVYPLLWHPVRTRIDQSRAPDGRIVGVEYTYDYQPSEPDFQAALGPNDVVWVPLFDGTVDDPAQDSTRRREEYEKNVRAISEIAPRVRAVLTGNANAEILFRGCPIEERHQKCLTFIQSHAAFLAHHGRPAFSPVFELFVFDCYRAGGELRDLINASNALVLSFAGCSWLVEHEGPHPYIPEDPPYPRLAEYLASMEAWSGVGTLRGLANGSADVLKASGYSAGFAGWY